MKQKVVFSALAVILSIASVQAAERDRGREEWKLYQYNFLCEFGGGPGNTPSNNDRYKAAAKVFAWDKERHAFIGSEISPFTDTTFKLAVLKDNELIYAGGANMSSEKKFVAISAPEGSPAIYVIRHHSFEAFGEMRYKAFIKDGHRKAEGVCVVDKDEVRHSIGAEIQ